MKDKLFKQGADAAQRAVRHYLNSENDQFFIQAGISFELLGKARLAKIHPSLIIDKDFDSFLHACSAGKHSKRLPWNLKTISATEVLQRCTQIHPDLQGFAAQLKLLAECRNSTIHLGEVPITEVKRVFQTYLAGTSELAKGLEVKPDEVFGEFSEMVLQQLDESLAEIQRNVAGKLARAKDNFRLRYGAFDSEQLEALISVIEAGYQISMEKYRDELDECPACHSQGLISGDYDLDWDVDVDDDGSIMGANPMVTLNAFSFICNVCGLSLDGSSELKAAGLRDSINIENVDGADFYEEPHDY